MGNTPRFKDHTLLFCLDLLHITRLFENGIKIVFKKGTLKNDYLIYMMLFTLDYFKRLGKWITFDLLKTFNWLNVYFFVIIQLLKTHCNLLYLHLQEFRKFFMLTLRRKTSFWPQIYGLYFSHHYTYTDGSWSVPMIV